MKVLIATKNQGKIEGAKKALEHYFRDVEIIGVPVESNVPDQPVNKEIYDEAKVSHKYHHLFLEVKQVLHLSYDIYFHL